MQDLIAVKGNVIYTKTLGKYDVVENGYVVVNGKTVVGVYQDLEDSLEGIKVLDYGDALIIPGFNDIHVHAPQFANIGLGLDKELMPWLEAYTFPEEAKYADLDYAKWVYSTFVNELWKAGTTRACVFGTIHKEATSLLMDLFFESGLGAYVGKVNMDRNSPDFLIEKTEDSIQDTYLWLKTTANKYELVKPIITPRFVPTCTLGLLQRLGDLAYQMDIPVQSHLSENMSEKDFVKALHPNMNSYASIYDRTGLFGETPTIMAHCVLVDESEIDLMAKKGVFVAHSPNSNCNLSSGIAPVRRFLDRGVKVGLGSDVSGGHSLSMMNVMVNAQQMSNIKWIESHRVDRPLNTAEVFYLATKGGGQFFGQVGSFEPGYAFDALVIDDSNLPCFNRLTIEERLQKFIYTGDDRHIIARFVAGHLIKEPLIYKRG
jgi:guanine deaminase